MLETLADDEAAVTAALLDFIKDTSVTRAVRDGVPVRRFNQGRHTGCVEAELIVADGLPDDLRVGLFAQSGTYPAWVRFANASSTTDREADVRGMAIQVSYAALLPDAANLTPGAATQDFVLNSHPVMVAKDTRAFFEFLQAQEAGGLRLAGYLLTHPRVAIIGAAARSHPTCHLDIPYYSATPYLFGGNDGEGAAGGVARAVKYIALPSSDRTSPAPARRTETYLREALRARLADGEARFDLCVQFQRDPGAMPIEDASVEWSREASPYRAVARLRIPPQRIDEPARMARCEEIAFDPWHCLADHRPLGNMNRARRAIYAAMAEFRRPRP